MMVGYGDPGVRAALGGSLMWEELRGDFAAARRCASAGSLDAALVDLVAGRPGAARAILASLGAVLDDGTQLLVRRLGRLADALGYNHGPGGDGTLDDELAARWDRSGAAASPRGDSPRRLVGEAAARELALAQLTVSLLATRSTISLAGRRGTALAGELLALGLPDLEAFAAELAVADGEAPCSLTWAMLAIVDQRRRAGDTAGAVAALHVERARCDRDSDAVGLEQCWLTEGDRAAVTIEEPLT